MGIALIVAAAACGGSSNGDADAGSDPYVPPFAECAGGDTSTVPPAGSLCLDPVDQPADTPPIAVIEHEFVVYEGVDAVHIKVILDPSFVDNTYGTTAVGWSRDHKFNDLVGSDHATVVVLNANGDVVFDLDFDYLSADPDAPCGYSSLGVDGGDGGVNVGDRNAILGWTTSLDQNLNDRGYCDFLTDSPATDENCTPNPLAPNWDFRVVYEFWLALSAFDPIGFGSAYMSFVHASPAKGGTNTVDVEPGDCPCPPDVDTGDCAPSPGGDCTDTSECSTNEFCHEGHCIPIVT